MPHRVPCRVSSVDAFGRRQSAIGETLNVSDEGVAVQVGLDLSPGTPIEVLIPHLDGEPACLLGQVVHRRRAASGTFELGISLTPPTPPEPA